jgi:hypothetical protein
VNVGCEILSDFAARVKLRYRAAETNASRCLKSGGPSTPAPILAQHTRSALKELFGLEDAVLDDLAARRVVFEAEVPTESSR